MWTLNARRHIRIAGSSGYLTSSSDRAQTIGRSRLVRLIRNSAKRCQKFYVEYLFTDPPTRGCRTGSSRHNSGPYGSRDRSSHRCMSLSILSYSISNGRKRTFEETSHSSIQSMTRMTSTSANRQSAIKQLQYEALRVSCST